MCAPDGGFVEIETDEGYVGWGEAVPDYVRNQDDFRFTDGFAALPKLPGLGVDVNKELVIDENKSPHNWKNPVWHHSDGSVAEW